MMVEQMGMSDIIGPRAVTSQGGNPMMGNGEGDLLRDKADAEIDRILTEQYDRGMTLLTENKDVLDAVAKSLIENEKIDGIKLLETIRNIRPSLVEDKALDAIKEAMKPELEARAGQQKDSEEKALAE